MAKITREKALESAKKYNDAQKARTVIPLVFLGGIGALFGSLKLVSKKKYYLIPFFGFFLGLIMMIVFIISSGNIDAGSTMFDKVSAKYDGTSPQAVVFTQGEEEKRYELEEKSGELSWLGSLDIQVFGPQPVGGNNATQGAKTAARKAASPYVVSYTSQKDYNTYRFINEEKTYSYKEMQEKYGEEFWYWDDLTNTDFENLNIASDNTFKIDVKFTDGKNAKEWTITLPSDRVARNILINTRDIRLADEIYIFNGTEFEYEYSFRLGYNTQTNQFDVVKLYNNEEDALYLRSAKWSTHRTLTFIFMGVWIASFIANLALLTLQKNSANAYVTYVKKCSKSLDKDQREGFVNSMLDAARGNDLEKAAAILDEKGFDVQAASEEVATEVTEETTAE